MDKMTQAQFNKTFDAEFFYNMIHPNQPPYVEDFGLYEPFRNPYTGKAMEEEDWHELMRNRDFLLKSSMPIQPTQEKNTNLSEK